MGGTTGVNADCALAPEIIFFVQSLFHGAVSSSSSPYLDSRAPTLFTTEYKKKKLKIVFKLSHTKPSHTWASDGKIPWMALRIQHRNAPYIHILIQKYKNTVKIIFGANGNCNRWKHSIWTEPYSKQIRPNSTADSKLPLLVGKLTKLPDAFAATKQIDRRGILNKWPTVLPSFPLTYLDRFYWSRLTRSFKITVCPYCPKSWLTVSKIQKSSCAPAVSTVVPSLSNQR